MKTYECPKCGSKDLFMKKSNTHTGLYCGDCGSWLKMGQQERDTSY